MNRFATTLPDWVNNWVASVNPAPIGAPLDLALATLDRVGCPRIQPFVDYYTRYAGMTLIYGVGAERAPLRFTVPPESQPSREQGAAGGWELEFGKWESSHVTLRMDSHGAIHFGFRGMRSQSLATTIEGFIADTAFQQLAVERKRVIDRVSVASADHVHRLAARAGLSPLAVMNNSAVRWWGGDDIALSVRPTNVIYCPNKLRYSAIAFWPRGSEVGEDFLTQGLTAVLEPHLGYHRNLPGFRQWRNGEGRELFDQSLSGYSKPTPAVSFRIFARRFLSDLFLRGPLSVPPPETDTEFEAYLLRLRDSSSMRVSAEVRYYTAVGLAAYGDSSSLITLLTHIPPNTETGWMDPAWAAQFVGYLLPGSYLCPLDDLSEAIRWISDHLPLLRWNNVTETYSGFTSQSLNI